MKNKQVYLSMLIAAMAMGTAWAVRGQFGHEQGAAWAGSIGSLAVLLVLKRADWYSKAFSVLLAGALGWGTGGIMSYGIVVGYGRGGDIGNVYYGLLMLFVIGGLYGFLGGGLFGLALANSRKKLVKWSNIIIELIAGAILIYFFFIMEFEWLMTPPRSELWAACLGMGLALTWYMVRNKQFGALRVAVFAGLGGGFGFAFGNFLQVMGNVLEIPFNFWNVMEYSLGFFGGLGMTYGTLTSEWEVTEDKHSKNSQLLPLLLVVLFIPFIVWQQTFEGGKLSESYAGLGYAQFADRVLWGALVLVVIFSVFWINKFYRLQQDPVTCLYNDLFILLAGHLGLYIVFSYLITGAWLSAYRIEQYLYFVNLVIILAFIGKTRPEFTVVDINASVWVRGFIALIIFIGVLALILINVHGELKGAQTRF